MSDDRTVHARAEGMEVARYDRAGKWYLEPLDSSLPRQSVTVSQAAQYAAWANRQQGGCVFLGRCGGTRFDALTRRLIASRTAPAPSVQSGSDEGTRTMSNERDPLSRGVDWQAFNDAAATAKWTENLLRAAVIAAGGEVTLTHSQIGEATISGYEVDRTDDGVTIRLTRRPGSGER